MNNNNTPPRDPKDRSIDRPTSYDGADATPRKEGGEDSAEKISPTDDNADEKVIVNEQSEHKTVNGEGNGNDEEII